MLDIITSFLRLQERDQLIKNLSKDLKDVPALQQRAKLQLAGDQAATETALAAVRVIEVKMKNLDLDIQTRQNTIKRLDEQKFATRKNEEFIALGKEMERYQQDVSSIEDKVIDQMELLEAAQAVHKAAATKLAETEMRVSDEIAALTVRGKALEGRVTEMTAERSGLTAGLDVEDLGMYDRLLKSKGHAAVVPVHNGNCGGCHMKLVNSTLAELRADDHIVFCEQCGRILYFA